MSQPSSTTLRFLHPCLLAVAITAIAVGCSHDEHPQGQAEAAADLHANASDSGHTVADHAPDQTATDEQATEDHAAHAAAAALPTPPATPWPSDAPLREGMRRMHQAVAALGHAEHGHLDATQASAAAQQVQDAANFMFANCKLAPEPDAALHGVLATLIGGAAAIKANPADTSPVASMRDAIALYPRLFEDATWQADTAPAK